jgi:2-polyprenyl-6-methoxyphenol hydroxylase-like FAD-dependent oxidoreductase
MSNKRIAIVGAGVAGIALAIFAAKQGHQVSLYERDSKVSCMGAGVTLWPNAMFVLQQLGLDKEIQHMGGIPRCIRQLDRHGVLQTELEFSGANTLSAFPSVTILRRSLMDILARTLAHLDVKKHFDYPVTTQDICALKQEFDLVVGADGRMHSVVRQSLYPEEVYPSYQGFINIIGISQLGKESLDNAILDFRAPSERFGIVPVKEGLCYWAAGWSTPIDHQRPLSSWYDEMHQRFGTWSEPVQDILSCYEKESLKRIFVHDIDPLPYWHQDNVIIIGDAAHAPLPTSGQGACQALEDAWHLAQSLKKESTLESILTAFYQQRIAKTSAVQNIGRQLAQRIFTDHSETQLHTTGPSPKQLSEFWMQGLEFRR